MQFKRPTTLFALLLGLLLGGLLVWGPAFAAGEPQEAEANAGPGFTYQGRLTRAGSALTDSCAMAFSLWDSADGGTQIGATETIANVAVAAGRFTVILNTAGTFGSQAFNGAARWLSTAVNCSADAAYTPLTPRQALTAVPMAQTLRPGSLIKAATGSALTVESASTSASALVVNGVSTNSAFPSLKVNNSGDSGYGFYVNKTNGSGVASFGANNGATGSGVAGYSSGWYGVYGYTGTASNNYGFYSPDNLYTRNVNMPGATMVIVQNGSESELMAGDVVAFSGVTFAAADPTLPLPQVTRSAGAAVAGVVYGPFDPALLDAPPEGQVDRAPLADGPVKPGGYLLLVISGVARVNVDAARGAIAPGTPLHVTAAGRAAAAGNGPLIGTALEAPAGDALYVFVAPR